jgi:hypothetical protein
MSITKEQLKQRFARPTKTIAVDGDELTIRKPSPLEWSRYQAGLVDPKSGQFAPAKMGPAQMNLVASMLVDSDGSPLVDSPNELDALPADYYEAIKEECIRFASGKKFEAEAAKTLGESEETQG